MARRLATLNLPAPVVATTEEVVAADLRLREHLAVLAAGFVVYLALVLYFWRVSVFAPDAVSRTASAFFVLFSRDPHLGAIGFVWNPLPAFIQLPVVFVFHYLGIDVILAGGVVTALLGAGTLVFMNWLLFQSGIGRIRYALVALYGLNPMIALYSANGMSEALFIFLLVLIVCGFIRWGNTGTLTGFLGLTAASVLVVQTRYEALAFVAAVTFCLVPVLYPLAKYLGIDVLSRRIEAYLITYLGSVSYSFGLWIYFNWTIMGDPLHFLHSNYGNLAQTAVLFGSDAAAPLRGAAGSIVGATVYGLWHLGALYPIFFAVLLAGLVVVARRRQIMLFCVLLMAVSVPAFEILMLYRASSFGWLRFFMYGIPFTILLLAELHRSAPDWFDKRRSSTVWSAIIALMLLSNVASWLAMNTPQVGREEWLALRKVSEPSFSPGGDWLEEHRAIANAIEELPPKRLVLLPTYLGYAIPLVAPDPTRYIVTSDREFDQVLAAPAPTASYIMVPQPEGNGKSDPVNQKYSTLWERGTPWTEFVRDFRTVDVHWRLYKVLRNPDDPVQPVEPTAGASGDAARR
ncbi:MAG: hypothetical protein HY329_09830 [Chloroflexi bacterium]|nr:hypothetical protein [Chloroflexota bacterium]